MKTKALYQMTLDELREQEQFYCDRTSHADLLMLGYIREAIAAKAPVKTHTDAINEATGYTSAIVRRVICEVAGTIATNGIQELSRDGSMSSYTYVTSCIIGTAYNALRAFDGFSYSFNEFCKAVDETLAANMVKR